MPKAVVEKLTVKITAAKLDEKDNQPFVGLFPTGGPALTAPQFQLQVYKSTGKKKKRRRVAATVHDQSSSRPMKYVADNFGDMGHSQSSSSCKYAVGVYNKSTGKLRLVPADDVFSLRPVLARDSIPDKQADDEDASMSKKMQLTAKFGSVKRQSELQRYKMNQLGLDNIVSDSAAGLEARVEQKVSDAAATKTQNVEAIDRSFLPSGYDTETHIKAQIYPLSSMVPEPVAAAMAAAAKKFAAGTKAKSDFVQGALRVGVPAEQQVALFYLYNLLIVSRLDESKDGTAPKNFRASIRVKRELLTNAVVGPSAVSAHILSYFSHGAGPIVTVNREKIVFCILILALTISFFDLDPNDLAADMRLTTIRLTMYLREIGCKVKSAPNSDGSKKYRCSLVAPLVFPETKRRGRGPPG